MHGLDPALAAVSDPEPAGLVVGGVRDRSGLAIAALAREPDLHVVGLRGRARDVAGREHDDPVRKSELAHELLGVREQELVLVPGVVRSRERELLDLVELVDADHPARVPPGRTRFAAEAGREGDVAERQLVRVEDLAGVEARERDLGRAGQVEAVGRKLVDVRLIGREGAGSDQRLLAHEHRWQHRDEAVRRQPVERQPVEREREPRRVADPVAEAGTGHPSRALHVEAADLDVLARAFGRRRLADPPELLHVVLGGAVRSSRRREDSGRGAPARRVPPRPRRAPPRRRGAPP